MKNQELKYEEKHSPIVYTVYKYLKENCIGYDNRQRAWEIQKELGINDNKTFRDYINTIRNSDTLQKFICSKPGATGGYWVATNDEDVQQTLDHLYFRAMDMLKTIGSLKRKAKLNHQLRLKISKYEKEMYESIMEDNKNG